MRVAVVISVLVLAALGVGLFDVAKVDAGNTGVWSTPIQLSGAAASNWAWWPAVAADDAGNVYVVWHAHFGSGSLDATGLYFTRWDGRGWSEPNDIALIGLADGRDDALRSSLRVTRDGQLSLSYKGLGTLTPDALRQKSIWYMQSAGSGAISASAWSQPTMVSGGQEGYFSDIAIDREGTIHMLWTEASTGGWGIFYSQSKDGGKTWSRRQALAPANPVWWYRAHLTVDDQGHLHAVWEELGNRSSFGVTQTTVYAQSTDDGQTWTTVHFGGTTPEGDDMVGRARARQLLQGPGPQQPTVGTDGAGNVLLVYREPLRNQIVYMQSKNGITWSAPSAIPGIRAGVPRPYDIYDMATDSAGHVHLVAIGYPTNSDTMSLMYSEWTGESWTPATVITKSPPYPEYPRLAIGQGNRLHVVWFVGDQAGPDRSPIGIWYSTALADAPTTVSQARTASPSRSAAPAATPTPLAADALGTVANASQPRTLSTAPHPSDNGTWLSRLQTSWDYPLVMTLGFVVPTLASVTLLSWLVRRKQW